MSDHSQLSFQQQLNQSRCGFQLNVLVNTKCKWRPPWIQPLFTLFSAAFNSLSWRVRLIPCFEFVINLFLLKITAHFLLPIHMVASSEALTKKPAALVVNKYNFSIDAQYKVYSVGMNE